MVNFSEYLNTITSSPKTNTWVQLQIRLDVKMTLLVLGFIENADLFRFQDELADDFIACFHFEHRLIRVLVRIVGRVGHSVG